MKPKSSPPKTVAALIAGIIFVLAFAVWNISRSVSPAPPASPSVSTAPAAVVPGAVVPGAVVPIAMAGTAAPLAGTAGAEAFLAPMADPFRPLPLPAQSAVPVASAKASPAPPAGAAAPGTPPAAGPGVRGVPGLSPLPPARPGQMLAATAFPSGPVAPLSAKLGAAPKPATAPKPAAAPMLVGTILGDRPSAVFQQGEHLRVVPLGARLGPWRVISVSHGGAVVADAGRKVGLHIGVGQAAALMEEAAPPEGAMASSDVPAATGPAHSPGPRETAQASPPDRVGPAPRTSQRDALMARESRLGLDGRDLRPAARMPEAQAGKARLFLHVVGSRLEAPMPQAVLPNHPARTPKVALALAPEHNSLRPSHRPRVHRLKHRRHRRPRHRSHHRRSHHLFGHYSHRHLHRH